MDAVGSPRGAEQSISGVLLFFPPSCTVLACLSLPESPWVSVTCPSESPVDVIPGEGKEGDKGQPHSRPGQSSYRGHSAIRVSEGFPGPK